MPLRCKLFLLLFCILLSLGQPQRSRQPTREKELNEPQQPPGEPRRSQQQQPENETSNSSGSKPPPNSSSSNPPPPNFAVTYASLFPSDPPKHVLEGVWKAGKSVLLASGIALLSLIGLPIILAQKSGLPGLVGGIVLAAVSGSVAALAGIVHGVHQIVVGLYKTPAYLEAAWSGKHWDPVQQEWIQYSLQQEVNELLSSSSGSRRVQDLSYYHLLGVPANATAREIKRAYYQKAKDVHPDKNPDDQEAATKFLQLHNVYQTLADEDKRAAYDEWGSRPSSSFSGSGSPLGHFRPDVFFAVLFGSQLVEPYIGQLTVATFVGQLINLSRMTDTITVETLSIWRDESVYQSRKRQVEIASNLLDRIKPFVSGEMTAEEFRKTCREEGNRIAQAGGGFGGTFLDLIGSNLQLQSSVFLGLRRRSVWRWPHGIVSVVRRRKRGLENSVRSIAKTVELIRGFVNAATQSAEEGKKRIPAEKIEELLPKILEVAWAHNVHDISKTLQGACQKLFDDTDAHSRDEQVRRAEAVQILGEEFVVGANWRKDSEMNADDVKARLSVAFRLAQFEKTGENISKEESEQMIQQVQRRGGVVR